jgi:phage gpG-like protein
VATRRLTSAGAHNFGGHPKRDAVESIDERPPMTHLKQRATSQIAATSEHEQLDLVDPAMLLQHVDNSKAAKNERT